MFKPGQTIDGMRIERVVGHGGMGTVHRAVQLDTRRVVAVKSLHPHLATDPDFRRRFSREISLALRLDHRNVARVLGHGEVDDTPYVVLEFIHGQLLNAAIAEAGGRLPTGAAISIIRQVCDVLAAAERLGLVHRDIKPDNIMVTPHGRVRVLDFGLAKDIGSQSTQLTASGAMLGTPAYMSPEQAMGASDVDVRSDLYSLGVTAYQMLTGTTPFRSDTPMGYLRQHMSTKPRPTCAENSDVPPDLGAFVDTLLAKKPGDRPPSAGAALGILDRIVQRRIDGLPPLTAGEPTTTAAGDPGAEPAAGTKEPKHAGTGEGMPWLTRPTRTGAGGTSATDLTFESPAAPPKPKEAPAAPRHATRRTTVRKRQPPRDATGQAAPQGASTGRKRARRERSATTRARPARAGRRREAMIAASIVLVVIVVLGVLAVTNREDRSTTGTETAAVAPIGQERPTVPPASSPRPPDGAQGHAYSDQAIRGFDALLASSDWRAAEPPRNGEGLLEAVHARTDLTFVLIPAGEFEMGSPDTDPERDRSETRHRVTLANAFLLCETECTQKAWRLGGGAKTSKSSGDTLPVESVSWLDAATWCKKAGLRLPTEAEWEYACRAGGTGGYTAGVDTASLRKHAWFLDNSEMRTHAVGQRAANRWGLHDVHGNVREWCADALRPYSGAHEFDPFAAPEPSSPRVVRGGAYGNPVALLRCAARSDRPPDLRESSTGFRPAASLPGVAYPTEPTLEPTAVAWARQLGVAVQRYSSGTVFDTFREFIRRESDWTIATPPVNAEGMLEAVHGTTGLRFVLIPEGTFVMGTKLAGVSGLADETPHAVTLTRPYLLCKSECTQAAWERLEGSDKRSFRGPDLPIEGVSWEAATDWCRRAGLRLPTEAEWENACRAGSTMGMSVAEDILEFLDTDELEARGWCKENSLSRPHPVNSKPANAWGLHDMQGNVREWCFDWYGRYGAGSVTDPRGPTSPTAGRVFRGGGWSDPALFLRSSWRNGLPPTQTRDCVGFRPARSVVVD